MVPSRTIPAPIHSSNISTFGLSALYLLVPNPMRMLKTRLVAFLTTKMSVTLSALTVVVRRCTPATHTSCVIVFRMRGM